MSTQRHRLSARIYAVRFDRAGRETDTIYLRAYSRQEAEEWLRKVDGVTHIYPPRQPKRKST